MQSAPPTVVARHIEDLLDEALEETFPASDPIAVHIGQPPFDEALDEALDETFPASDPVAIRVESEPSAPL